MHLVRPFIYEKFTEKGDPIHDLGIGMKKLIKQWLEKMQIKKYVINDDLSIDVYGEVNLNGKLNGNLPDYIKFNIIYNNFGIDGCFLCDNNNMTTLRGCPKEVDWYFSCANNKLTSLKYAPKKATNFYCQNNRKKFTVKDVLDKCEVQRTIFLTNSLMYDWNVQDHLNEKFTEDLDPIKDLGIGSIDIYQRAQELITSHDEKGLKSWLEYMKSLHGKIISGYFRKGNFGESKGQLKYYEFKIKNVHSYMYASSIHFKDESGQILKALEGEKYKIRDEVS